MKHTVIVIETRCGRCGRKINYEDAEVCWWCQHSLCIECWETVGHCGHPEAEAVNQAARELEK